MKNEKSLEVFNKMSVPQAVMKNAIPAMVAMLMVLIYNLADTFLSGRRITPIRSPPYPWQPPFF